VAVGVREVDEVVARGGPVVTVALDLHMADGDAGDIGDRGLDALAVGEDVETETRSPAGRAPPT
jgi:hypothetical protein